MKKQRNLLILPQRGNSDNNTITHYKNKFINKNNNNTYLLNYLLTNLLTYLFHGAESFLRS